MFARILVVFLAIWLCSAWRPPSSRQVLRTLATLGLGLGLSSGPVLADDSEPLSLAQQLRQIQAQKVAEQKARLDSQDHDLLSQELLLPEGELLARGTLTLVSDKLDLKAFPLGYDMAENLDPKFASPNSRLFLLCVGRDSTIPIAARSIPLAELHFPMAFELKTKDLLFPYTAAAWLASPNHVDTVAVTAFLTPEDKLSVANPSIRAGFGLSDPVSFAGKMTRATAPITVGSGDPIDTGLFTASEIALLTQVDAGIAKNSNSK